MNSLDAIGKMLIFFGLFIVVAGAVLMAAGKIGGLGRLPGDIFIQKGNFTFYFPVVTMIIVSVMLSLIFNIFFKR
ncbi:Protein of unknown function [Desulfotomaculum arcticum]|uniref:DUF2905 domain-containing protein n=1 Tax=Desulfotruncus arcticus DSM 17038 TaxID=1121424 RepID=A0A1I2SEM1_9FIRM|nr:DUF2905 domain-containing protein [Desulfotruncus arcticus]SFG51254.1 Protein of unknown function [Desulfotomaculum arcticum] [Desulfotruncus arcticus DSM 17038]